MANYTGRGGTKDIGVLKAQYPTLDRITGTQLTQYKNKVKSLYDSLKPKTIDDYWNFLYNERKNPHGQLGKYDPNITPYFNKIFEDIVNTNYTTFTIKTSTQMGKTEFLINMIVYYAFWDPSTILFITKDESLASKFLNNRLIPAMPDQLLNTCKVRTSNNQLSIVFPGGHCYFSGAGNSSSISKLISNPIRIILIDECSQIQDKVGKSGQNFLKQIESRSDAYELPKTILVSTPDANIGWFYDAYMKGTRSEYRYYCNKHKVYSPLIYNTYDNKPNTLFLNCCKDKILDQIDKNKLIKNNKSKFIDMFPKSQSKSYILPFYHSVLRNLNKGDIEYKNVLEDKKANMPTFLNNFLAQEVNAKILDTRDFNADSISKTAQALDIEHIINNHFVSAGIDVGNDYLQVVICAWKYELKRIYYPEVIHACRIKGDVKTAEPYNHLFTIINKFKVNKIAIDVNYYESSLYIYKNFNNFLSNTFFVKGSDFRIDRNYTKPVKAKLKGQFEYKVFRINVNKIKSDVLPNFKLINFHNTLPAGFYKQLCSEELVVSKTGKKIWEKKSENHYLDAFVYNYAVYNIMDLSNLLKHSKYYTFNKDKKIWGGELKRKKRGFTC